MPQYRTVEKDDNSLTAKRIFVVGAVIALSFGVLVCRALTFRLKDNDQIDKVAMRQYRTAVTQSTRRGKIFDRKGRELAFDVPVDSVFANPREIESPVKAAEVLSSVLGVERSKLLERFSANRKFVWVKRRVDEKQSAKVEDLNLKGVYKMRENARFYPGKTLASSVLGAVGFDSEPLGGVELAYDKHLSTRKGATNLRRDARGHLYLSPTDDEKPEVHNAWLTIDSTLQYITERELEQGVKKSRSKGGAAIVVDVKNGEILAMASYPGFDPNEYSKYPFSHWKNRAVSDVYEPGSTFKVVVVAAALNAGVVKPDDVFDCENGRLRVANHVIGDTHPYKKITVADIIKVSSNIGSYKVEQQLGKEGVYDAIRNFGFGKVTGFDLPGESVGILAPVSKWSPLQFATIAFGQGIAATPLQMTMAFAAIANGGTLFKPYLVKQIISEEGVVTYEGRPEITFNPITPATAKMVREMLVRVVGEGGTGKLAYSSEYSMAGKTGTAQKADPKTGKYAKGKYNSSFVGFAPAKNPMIAVYVGMDEPADQLYYGGQIAAPVFKNISEAALKYAKVPAEVLTVSQDVYEQLPPSAIPGELAIIDDLDAPAQIGERVFSAEGEKKWKMPDLRGLTFRDVLAASKDVEIEWNFVGSGVAVKQSIEAGNTVSSGNVCKVEFRPLM
jgi:cell division protein FtsI (penicillin-binding protein 3)